MVWRTYFAASAVGKPAKVRYKIKVASPWAATTPYGDQSIVRLYPGGHRMPFRSALSEAASGSNCAVSAGPIVMDLSGLNGPGSFQPHVEHHGRRRGVRRHSRRRA